MEEPGYFSVSVRVEPIRNQKLATKRKKAAAVRPCSRHAASDVSPTRHGGGEVFHKRNSPKPLPYRIWKQQRPTLRGPSIWRDSRSMQ